MRGRTWRSESRETRLLVGRNPYSSEAGIASILADVRPGREAVSVYGLAIVSGEGAARVLGASLALRGRRPSARAGVSPPTGRSRARRSPRYRGPVEPNPGLRAGLVVQGKLVASLAADAPKFRIPATAPPEKREPFHR